LPTEEIRIGRPGRIFPVNPAGQGHQAFRALGDRTEEPPAICIGPEHGTVGALLIKEAAKEAVQGVGFDMLIVCGIEATNSKYKRPYGGDRLRVRGSPAVTRTVKFKFMALNIRRYTKPARKTQNQAA
jgi:hypothetical protein